MSVIQALILALSWGAVGFIIGKYTERIQWNNLIKVGKIRKPF